MQKFLVVVLGVLGVVLIVELGILFTQSSGKRQQVSNVAPSPNQKQILLPLSSPEKNGVNVYTDPADSEINKYYTTWSDGGFYYFRSINSAKSVAPYLVRGVVKATKENSFEIEAKTADQTFYRVMIKLLPDATVTKNNKTVASTEITVGDMAQFLPIRSDQKENGYYLVRKVTIF